MTSLKAVIVAAGVAQRMQPLTNDIPKCFLPVGGRPLIEYSLEALKDCGITEVAFVVGYMKDEFPARLGNAYEYIYNPFYATTNDMASLWFAKDYVRDSDFVYMHSDLLYHPEILKVTVASRAEIALAVEETECDDEMMKVRVDGLYLLESSKEIPADEAFGEWTGIARFSSTGWNKYLPAVEQLLAAGAFNVYDTAAMNLLVQQERVIQIVPFQRLPFIEIDYAEDLRKARDEIAPRLASLCLERAC